MIIAFYFLKFLEKIFGTSLVIIWQTLRIIMETVSRIKKVETNTLKNEKNNIENAFEVVVIEDNHLANTVLSKALNSAINSIQSLKNKRPNYYKRLPKPAFYHCKGFLGSNT